MFDKEDTEAVQLSALVFDAFSSWENLANFVDAAMRARNHVAKLEQWDRSRDTIFDPSARAGRFKEVFSYLYRGPRRGEE